MVDCLGTGERIECDGAAELDCRCTRDIRNHCVIGGTGQNIADPVHGIVETRTQAQRPPLHVTTASIAHVELFQDACPLRHRRGGWFPRGACLKWTGRIGSETGETNSALSNLHERTKTAYQQCTDSQGLSRHAQPCKSASEVRKAGEESSPEASGSQPCPSIAAHGRAATNGGVQGRSGRLAAFRIDLAGDYLADAADWTARLSFDQNIYLTFTF